ncbi:hypothetical protein FOZ63_000098, partial [Perkinsus olseni]
QRFEEAIKDLRKAVHSDPPPEASMADLYYHLGLCEANVGTRPQRALHAFTEAMKCLPSEGPPKPHYVHEKAKALQMCGEHEKALRHFSEVLRWQPLNARAMFRRAFSFKALKMFDEAAEDFEAARELEPNDMRFVVNYKKIADYEAVTLGPAGYEDQIPYRDAKAPVVPSLDRGVAKYNELVAEVDYDDDDDDDLRSWYKTKELDWVIERKDSCTLAEGWLECGWKTMIASSIGMELVSGQSIVMMPMNWPWQGLLHTVEIILDVDDEECLKRESFSALDVVDGWNPSNPFLSIIYLLMAVAAAKAGPASKGNRSRRRQSLRESLDRANELRESVEKKYGVGRRGSGKAHDVKLVVCGDGLVGGRSRSRTPPQTRAAKSPRFTR